jgi:DNA-binding MarR family transcriptional regulator
LTKFVATCIIELVDRKEQTGSRPRLTPCLEEEVFLELCRTTDLLSRKLAGLLKAENLSANQYNVLRILRGAPEGLPCGEIGNRMITRDPDITRLLDRLEKRELIERWRDATDRRVVMAKITPEGLKLLGTMDEPIREGHRSQLGHLGASKLRLLSQLLQNARAGVS